MIFRLRYSRWLCLLCGLVPAWVLAQAKDNYPNRPIRVITGSPGSTSDLSARFVAQKLTERWGQQAVVFVVHPSIAANNLKDFIAYSQAQGGKVNFASPGAGTSGHLTGELFNLVTKARMTHIPYKGAGFAVTANIAGEVHSSFLSTTAAQPHVKAGRLKPLVVVHKTRFSGTPEVPSSVEAGYPDLDSNAWFGLFARLNKEVADALNTPQVKATLLGQGVEVAPTSPEEFGAYVKAEAVKWARVVKESGYKTN